MCQPEGRRFERVPALLRALGRSLARYQVPAGRALLVTMNLSTLQQARTILPALPRAYEVASNGDLTAGLRDARAQQAEAIVLSSRSVTPAQPAQVRAAGLRVVVFGGRSTSSIRRILASQPDEIEVDNVGKLLSMQGPVAASP
jgi:glycerophosphoryl diester phosphodiesterase